MNDWIGRMKKQWVVLFCISSLAIAAAVGIFVFHVGKSSLMWLLFMLIIHIFMMKNMHGGIKHQPIHKSLKMQEAGHSIKDSEV